jgi:transposase-like protein
MRTRRPRSTPVLRSAFAGFRFPADVIMLAVRWYLRFSLSYRDLEELLAERGIEVDHVTIYRWVQRFTPLLADAARPCRHGVGARWQVDETYVKVAGHWRYVYRAIDQFGQVIEVFVSGRRDTNAAHRFFQRAIGAAKVTPVEVTTDQAPVYPAVLAELLPSAWHRTDRYGNNRVEWWPWTEHSPVITASRSEMAYRPQSGSPPTHRCAGTVLKATSAGLVGVGGHDNLLPCNPSPAGRPRRLAGSRGPLASPDPPGLLCGALVAPLVPPVAPSKGRRRPGVGRLTPSAVSSSIIR